MRILKYLKSLKFLFNKYPSYIVLFPTSRCNASCEHCFNWKNAKDSINRKEISLDEIEKTFKDYGHIMYLSISGGEPTLRDDIDQICYALYRNNELRYVALHTNGHLAEKIRDISKNIVRKCPNLFLNVCISIDGDRDNTHDKIRKLKGNFNNIVKTITLLKELEHSHDNIGITSVSVLSSLNKNNMNNIHDFVNRKLKISHGAVLIRGDIENNRLKDVSVDEYNNFYNYAKNYKNKIENTHLYSKLRKIVESLTPFIVIKTLQMNRMVVPCQAGKKEIVIYDNGDVFPCEQLNQKMGNIRDVNYNIIEILSSENSKKILDNIKEMKCYCTWECMIPVNLIFSLKGKLLVIKNCLRLIK